MNIKKIMHVENLTHFYGNQIGCKGINFDLYKGEILGIVGESGSGKSTLLKCLSGEISPSAGKINISLDQGGVKDFLSLPEQEKRQLMRSMWGIVHQNPRDGLNLRISAGGNIAERLLNVSEKNYSFLRNTGKYWMEKTEMDPDRIDEFPISFSGGMQQRLQISKILSSNPQIVFMDEPTGGLDVSVQAKILDTIKSIVRDINVTMIIVTHDLAVVRFLTDKLLVMKDGIIVETGLTDRVLDDPQHSYSQLLTSSILQV